MIPEKVIYLRDLHFRTFSRGIASHKETTRVGKRTCLLISSGLIMVIELSGSNLVERPARVRFEIISQKV